MDYEANYNRIIARMIEHVDNGTTDQADDVYRVPVSAYTDEERSKKEIDLIFRKLPIFIGVSQEIPNPGDYKTIEMIGLPLLVVRQKDGSVRVMLNVCSHRAMLVAPEGKGNKGLFSCTYHGWSYNTDGSLRGISEKKKFGDVNKCDHGLTQLPTYERGGMIFAVLTPGLDVDFDDYLGGMLGDIERLKFPDWYYIGNREMKGANWKVAYDGYLEGYHFATAHPETIYPRSFSNIMEFGCYGPHMLIGYPQRSIGDLKEIPENERHKYENKGYDFIRTLFPNVSIFVAPELTQIAQLIPGPTASENKTIVYYIYNGQPDEEKQQELKETADWIWKVVEEEDYGLGLKVQQGLDAGNLEHVVFGRNERGNQYFHKMVDYYLKDDAGAEKPVL